ncbi:MAG: ABC transporter transmembrane domain-containing protein, partial [Bacteroidota bacterium]|nr:ABC transporter transmembrane domain-containing protein [Bacteroidota bacterium]
IIKAFNAEKYTSGIFQRYNGTYSDVSRRQWKRKNLIPVFSETSGVISVGLIMWFGGQQVFSGTMQASEFITYIILFSQILRPAKSLSTAFSNIHKGLASGDRVFSLLDEEEAVNDDGKAISHTAFTSAIEVK